MTTERSSHRAVGASTSANSSRTEVGVVSAARYGKISTSNGRMLATAASAIKSRSASSVGGRKMAIISVSSHRAAPHTVSEQRRVDDEDEAADDV